MQCSQITPVGQTDQRRFQTVRWNCTSVGVASRNDWANEFQLAAWHTCRLDDDTVKYFVPIRIAIHAWLSVFSYNCCSLHSFGYCIFLLHLVFRMLIFYVGHCNKTCVQHSGHSSSSDAWALKDCNCTSLENAFYRNNLSAYRTLVDLVISVT